MKITDRESYAGYDCTRIGNESLSLWVTNQVGPRIVGIELGDGSNLFAELPEVTIDCPGTGEYKLRGGHRLWQAPETPRVTYLPDDVPVSVAESPDGITFTQPVEPQTGIEKSLCINLPDQETNVSVQHRLKNCSMEPVELAAWAITQLNPGGTAILPQNNTFSDEHGLLPNRQIALWPYTQVTSKHITWGDRFIFIHATMTEGALKIGFPNPCGWIGYLRENTLFVKLADFERGREYFDYNSSSECYCNPLFLELETLSPKTRLAPGESLFHKEEWRIFDGIEVSANEELIAELVEDFGL